MEVAIMKRLFRAILTATVLTGLVIPQEPSERSMEGGFGTVTIDGKLWNQLSFRPVLPIWKFGVALDLVVYMDSEGNIHKDEWDFSSTGAIKNTLIDKIYYLRYGLPGDPLYVKVGALDRVTLGYGILVSDYSNAIQYPQVRKVGLEMEMERGRFGIEGFVNDFKEDLGTVGTRVTTKVIAGLEVGVSLVADRNQYLGLKDSDGDGRPDLVDDFPDNENEWLDSDGDGIADHDDLDIDGDGITDILDDRIPGWPGDPYVLDSDIQEKTNPINVKKESDAIVGAAVDIGYPLISGENRSVAVYAQIAKLLGTTVDPSAGDAEVSTGMGIVPFGLVTGFGPVRFNLEYRITPGKGRFDFWYWDRSYDVERATFRENADGEMKILTKESKLGRLGGQKGFYGKLGFDLGNLLVMTSEYQNLTGDIWNETDEAFEERSNQSFKTILSLQRGFSKLKGASLFYYQRNVPNPFKFEFTESTVLGYTVGIEIASGLTLNYVKRRTFTDLNGDSDVEDAGESINITSIETSFSF